ncbi:tetratricopeptide repeat protein [Flavobacterium sp. UBA6046]|jgi:tetratricopeptide (TPR) repeat protein|uniref:tetratricopeptide repeat protein n=1 Tax=Flavobacterium sp. UBA6046 TaxID=1946552 RepID=UPI0025B9A400|nr:tetratricopeptide repeat protein [Flavobacterium sp. UBA6046]
MKYIFTTLFSLIFVCSFAQQMSYDEWKKETQSEINLRPEYGNVVKSQGELKEDQTFVDLVLKQDTTPRKGSDHLVRLGFTYLSKGDMVTAMKRFNQAWLLDPKNENVYWGYGAIYGSFSDYSAAIVQYDKGLVINPESSVILTDKATLYFVQFQQDQDNSKLNTALDLLKRSYSIDPKNTSTTYKLSICYFLSKDCINAWKFYNECQKLGGQPIAENYTNALKNICPN